MNLRALLCCVAFFPALASAADAGVSPRVQAVLPTLRKLAADPRVVAAVKAQNAKKLSLEAIQKLDAEWIASTGVPEYVRALMEVDSAKVLMAFKKSVAGVADAFLMDNQGALVALTRKTSDYWQGDEAKFQKSFAQGKGAEFIDKAAFDESTQTYSVQVSIPVKDHGRAVGAITTTINLEQL